ncbi:MAG: class I SAM-dependent DNA methyltransferase [Paludibacter sp.]|nr:class I SAM-dependent DNA methyltransferase [Paludibacter sp.]
MSDVVNKLWGFCHTLRHEGIDYNDYIEQLSFLLFLKMADEKEVHLTEKYNWQALKNLSGGDLMDHYTDSLKELAKEPGLLGEIFTQAQNRFNNPVSLKKLLNLIEEDEWTSMDVDVKGAAFEGLLEKAASEGKKGAGQYFTPRPLIQSMVRLMKPDPRSLPADRQGKNTFTISDPACGTGGFLVCAYEWLLNECKGAFPREDVKRIRENTYHGQELVARPRRLALMNMYLHGVTPKIKLGDTIYNTPGSDRFDVVLANPPFGTKGANQVPERADFTVETSNKQLNFVQHIMSTLKTGGRAAIVLPDNVLFEDKAGEVFEILMQDCNLHTIIRLPRGTFTPYAQGVKANVIFLQKGLPTEKVWIYDNRSNIEGITKKDRPLTEKHFADFEQYYGTDPNGKSPRADQGETGRFRSFTIDEIKKRNYKLDITWLKDDSIEDANSLPEPNDLATEAIAELEAVVDDLKEILHCLNHDEKD